jgi:hypothetical protein
LAEYNGRTFLLDGVGKMRQSDRVIYFRSQGQFGLLQRQVVEQPVSRIKLRTQRIRPAKMATPSVEARENGW